MTLKHIPATHNRKQPGENPTHYYAVYKLKTGGQGMAVMTYEDVLELNMTLKHIPATHNRKQPGENPTHYYAVYKLKNGGQGMAVMTYEDVLEHAKKFSKTYSKKTGKFSGPWADNFDAMAKKTVLLKLMKYMPMAADTKRQASSPVHGLTILMRWLKKRFYSNL